MDFGKVKAAFWGILICLGIEYQNEKIFGTEWSLEFSWFSVISLKTLDWWASLNLCDSLYFDGILEV